MMNFLIKSLVIGRERKNSSVVLRKADVDYVVQQGDLIENTYRLISVSKNEIVFDRAGKQMYIKID